MNIASLKQQIEKRKKILIIHAVLVLAICNYFVPRSHSHSHSNSHSHSKRQPFRRATSSDPDNERPIMHTFYEKVKDGENDLLVAWKEEWTRAGFETRVLKLDDAKRHPYFKQMEKVVKPMFGKEYNAMCLYRWLAMAASGGGWMCDYDTFPTNFPMDEGTNLPYNGRFTSFEVQVPSLVSGTADEWTRVAKLLVEAMPKVKEKIKSDMHAFAILRTEGTHKIYFLPARLNMKGGFPYKKAISSHSQREVDCNRMAIGRAVHFAHYYTRQSYNKGMFPLHNVTSLDQALSRRGEAAKIFMADWREQCGGSNVQ